MILDLLTPTALRPPSPRFLPRQSWSSLLISTFVMDGPSDLYFDPGTKFQELVHQCFGCPVSPATHFSSFALHLIASFGRLAVRLNEDSIGLLLQSCIGGVTKDFNVFHLSGWMFSFSVSCKNVDFMIHKLKSFSCKSFAIFFFLWEGAGSNWRKEYDLWISEQEAEWTTVGSKFSKRSYEEIAKSKPVSKKSVFLHLNYPARYYEKFLDFSPVRWISDPLFSSNSNPRRRNSRPFSRWIHKNLSPESHDASILGPAPVASQAYLVPPLASSSFSNSKAGPTLCSRCLGLSHLWKDCRGSTRCLLCYNYGHLSSSCLSKAHLRHFYRPIPNSEDKGSCAPVATRDFLEGKSTDYII